MLVGCGADINHRDAGGWTALQAGIAEGAYGEPLAALLRYGADANLRVSGEAGCRCTWEDGRVQEVFAANDTALTLAVRCCRPDVVQLLLQSGVDANQCAEVDGVEHATALMIAAGSGSLHAFSLLMDHGADAARADASHQTALDYAEQYRQGCLEFNAMNQPFEVYCRWMEVHAAMVHRLQASIGQCV